MKIFILVLLLWVLATSVSATIVKYVFIEEKWVKLLKKFGLIYLGLIAFISILILIFHLFLS